MSRPHGRVDALFHVRNILAIQKNRSPLQELRAKAFARAGLSARLRPWSGLFERFDEPGTTLMLIPTTARILKGIAGGDNRGRSDLAFIQQAKDLGVHRDGAAEVVGIDDN